MYPPTAPFGAGAHHHSLKRVQLLQNKIQNLPTLLDRVPSLCRPWLATTAGAHVADHAHLHAPEYGIGKWLSQTVRHYYEIKFKICQHNQVGRLPCADHGLQRRLVRTLTFMLMLNTALAMGSAGSRTELDIL